MLEKLNGSDSIGWAICRISRGPAGERTGWFKTSRGVRYREWVKTILIMNEQQKYRTEDHAEKLTKLTFTAETVNIHRTLTSIGPSLACSGNREPQTPKIKVHCQQKLALKSVFNCTRIRFSPVSAEKDMVEIATPIPSLCRGQSWRLLRCYAGLQFTGVPRRQGEVGQGRGWSL